MAEQWLSIVEYARTYKVSDMTVRRRIKTGKLHAVLKEGKYFIPVSVGDARAMADSSMYDERPSPAPKRASGEMTVMKGHPAAHKTFAASQPRVEARQISTHIEREPPRLDRQERQEPRHDMRHERHEPRHDYHNDEPMPGEASLPQSLRRPLAGQETSLVDTRALLAFCDASLRKVSENERRTVEKFKSKLETLEATISGKDHEIKALRQQVEDLQLLVKILEKKKQG